MVSLPSQATFWRADRQLKVRMPLPEALRVNDPHEHLEIQAELDAFNRTVTFDVRTGNFNAPGPKWQPIEPGCWQSGSLPWAPLGAGAPTPNWKEVRMRPDWRPEDDEAVYAARAWLGSWRKGSSAHKARWTTALKAADRGHLLPLGALPLGALEQAGVPQPGPARERRHLYDLAAPLKPMTWEAQRARHAHGAPLLALQGLQRAAQVASALRPGLEPAALRWLLIQAALDPAGRHLVLQGEL